MSAIKRKRSVGFSPMGSVYSRESGVVNGGSETGELTKVVVVEASADRASAACTPKPALRRVQVGWRSNRKAGRPRPHRWLSNSLSGSSSRDTKRNRA